MVCHGGFSLPEETRRQWYNPEEILKRAGLREGMVFADIGCADGFFTLLASKVVGKNGKVYAIDVDSNSIEKLNTKVAAENISNVSARVGKAEDTIFCKGCVDIVFYSMDLHDFQDPKKVLFNASEMTKPNGMVVDLDWKKIDMPFGPPKSIRFSEHYVKELMASQKLKVKEIMDVGPYHYMLIAKPVKKSL